MVVVTFIEIANSPELSDRLFTGPVHEAVDVRDAVPTVDDIAQGVSNGVGGDCLGFEHQSFSSVASSISMRSTP